MQRESTVIAQTVYALRQGIDIIERLDDDLYSNSLPPFFRYAVGGHFRHLLDFYSCFLAGHETGRIDYDNRERDKLVERDRLAATARLRAAIVFLRELPARGEQKPVLVRMEDATRGSDPSRWSPSSIARELQFLLSHTVHHYALIA
ncbi:MAG TPA: hypothetical protein VLD57_04165, partial [Blastocatellia bacterium]|nr:hypothetical protein [Blastocatellia bacterium]